MSYSVCLIDDAFPTSQISEIDDTKRLNSSNLKALLAKDDIWADENVKTLTGKLVGDAEAWSVSAFTNPNIYFNCRKDELYTPEIVIFDWEYPTKDKSTAEHLQTILETCFSIIYIFTGADKKHEVDSLIQKEPFNLYKERIRVMHKEDKNSVENMLKEVKKVYESSFSFKFGKELRSNALNSIEKILVELGKITIKEASNYFANKKDLIDFTAERFRNYLISAEFENTQEKVSTRNANNDEIIKQLWFYRLYFRKDEKDKYVRRGDIIQLGDTSDTLYIVISGDCDLQRFWHKNLGHLTLLPLYIMKKENTDLIDKKLCLTRKKNELKDKLCQASLTGRIDCLCEGPFILPFLKINNVFCAYFGLPTAITSINVTVADNKLKDEPLTYGHLSNYRYLLSLSEPFLTPLIQNILDKISGVGVPDFGLAKDIIKDSNNTLLQ